MTCVPPGAATVREIFTARDCGTRSTPASHSQREGTRADLLYEGQGAIASHGVEYRLPAKLVRWSSSDPGGPWRPIIPTQGRAREDGGGEKVLLEACMIYALTRPRNKRLSSERIVGGQSLPSCSRRSVPYLTEVVYKKRCRSRRRVPRRAARVASTVESLGIPPATNASRVLCRGNGGDWRVTPRPSGVGGAAAGSSRTWTPRWPSIPQIASTTSWTPTSVSRLSRKSRRVIVGKSFTTSEMSSMYVSPRDMCGIESSTPPTMISVRAMGVVCLRSGVICARAKGARAASRETSARGGEPGGSWAGKPVLRSVRGSPLASSGALPFDAPRQPGEHSTAITPRPIRPLGVLGRYKAP